MTTLRSDGKAEEWRALFWQLVRFGLTGGAATAFYAIVYWPIATYAQARWPLADRSVWPLVGNVLGYLVAMLSGYVMHSRWSFRDVGERENLARTGGRFFIVSLVSFAMNTFFVWLLTGPMHGATWWPLVPILFVTPLVTFALNRFWVFA
ncbi:GtrA family protein [Sphingomonas sp. Leaf231]|uniref:GtrA family protein n=1 Tax=Sphingomonas sp. Leaf231 TaxID=1736301 RepID=UPI0009EBAA17|nr:GtrA family protein [Sphingomonas sp. Leaf231]